MPRGKGNRNRNNKNDTNREKANADKPANKPESRQGGKPNKPPKPVKQESPLEYVSGDMLAEANKVKAIAFGCHPEGVMNTELTLNIRNKYPDVYEEYLRRCNADPREFDIGQAMAWQTRDGMWVFVLGTQKDKYLSLASNRQIESAFRAMREQLEEHEITTLAMPPIGGGLGALYWHKSRKNLERVFKGWKGMIYVYVKP